MEAKRRKVLDLMQKLGVPEDEKQKMEREAAEAVKAEKEAQKVPARIDKATLKLLEMPQSSSMPAKKKKLDEDEEE